MSNRKFNFIFWGSFVLFLAVMTSIAWAVGSAVYGAGVVRLAVHEGRDGVHVSIPAFPIGVIASVVRGLDPEVRIEVDEQVLLVGPAIINALDEIERHPDWTIVEVRDGHDLVLIRKENDNIVVRVRGKHDEQVRLSIPVRVLTRSVRKTDV